MTDSILRCAQSVLNVSGEKNYKQVSNLTFQCKICEYIQNIWWPNFEKNVSLDFMMYWFIPDFW